MYVHTNMYKQIHVCKDAFKYNVSICIFINIYIYIYMHISFVESGVYCIYIYIYLLYTRLLQIVRTIWTTIIWYGE